MLAGRVRLKSFLIVVAGLALFGLGGVVFWSQTRTPEPEVTPPLPPRDPDITRRAPPPPPPPPETTVAPPDKVVDGPSLSLMEQAVFARLGKPLGAKKKKDIDKGAPFKINVYQDAGHSVANRAKVDLDRDDKWDEKWTYDAGKISKKISTADDDRYDRTLEWKQGKWSKP